MKNWPQIPTSIAEVEYQSIRRSPEEPKGRTYHPDQIYSPVGSRIDAPSIQQFIDDTTSLASRHGYPGPVSPEDRIRFDRAAATLLRRHMNISWADAGNTRLWSFVSLVALPHLTLWRFGKENRERWIASDLTRHTWARLWWQAVVFEKHEDLLAQLNESELNQLLERRVIGGDPRLVSSFATAVLANAEGSGRRRLIREAAKRLRRVLAFVDPLALDDIQLQELCNRLIAESTGQVNLAGVPQH